MDDPQEEQQKRSHSKLASGSTRRPTCPQATLWLFYFLLSLFTLAPVVSCFFIDSQQSPSSHQWSYSQQHDWHQLGHRQCDKKAQSPIDIQRRHVIQNNQLKLHFYNYNQPIKFKIQNAHHTIKLDPVEALRRDQFGLKLRPDDEGANSSSSLPDILSADEDMEPEFVSTTHHRNNNNNNHHHQQQQANESSHPNGHRHHQSRLPIGGQKFAGGQQLPALQSGAGQIAGLEHNSLEETGAPGLQANSESPPYGGSPTIKLDWLDDGNNEYKLRDIHFHWGERRDNGSEHAIDGRRAAMEMHLVHIKHGLDKSKIGFTSDSVTVIAILIESLRKSNADFNPIVNALARINMTEQTQEIEYKSINDLLPNILTSFYTYSGSLTTPPCYQVVNWIVMSDRLYLNAKQIEMFRNLYAPSEAHSQPAAAAADHGAGGSAPGGGQDEMVAVADPALIMPNIRHLQPLNNRTILASFAPLGRLEQISVGNSLYSGATSTLANGIARGGNQMWQPLVLLLVACVSLSVSVLEGASSFGAR